MWKALHHKSEAKGTKRELFGAKTSPKGSQRDPKRVKRQPKCIQKLKSERCRQKGRPQGGTIRSFGSNYGTFFYKKTMNKSMQKSMSKKYGHLWENAPKIMSKRGPKSMTNLWNVGTCDFLFFCEEYNVKIVFLHDQGYQKSVKNQWEINVNSMLENGMHKSWKMQQNGARMGAEIEKILIKMKVQKNIEI